MHRGAGNREWPRAAASDVGRGDGIVSRPDPGGAEAERRWALPL